MPLYHKNYNQYRIPYAAETNAVINKHLHYALDKSICLDIGAGSGLWTKQFLETNIKKIIAIESDRTMLNAGKNFINDSRVSWVSGDAHNLSIAKNTIHIISLATVLHLLDFDKLIKEIDLTLISKGAVIILWNPKIMQSNSLLQVIEKYLMELCSEVYTESFTKKTLSLQQIKANIQSTKIFDHLFFYNLFHEVLLSKNQFIGQWIASNHFQKKLGESKFKKFMEFLENLISYREIIKVGYKTILWIAIKK